MPLAAAEDDRRRVLLGRDLALRGEAHARELVRHRLAELGLGEQQEVVVAAPPDEQRRDHARLGGEQQRVDRIGREDVVREHALEEVGSVRPLDADVGARAAGGRLRNGGHRFLD